jgi:3-hydroxybutyryl-CoA dehydratase
VSGSANDALPAIAQGKFWKDYHIGWKARTSRRTVTETDLVCFISVTGILEPIFTDAAHQGAIGGRPILAALTYCFIEGLQLQSLLHGTGLALLEVTTVVDAPVRVGDTIWAVIEAVAVCPTSKRNRAVVSFLVNVFNQTGEQVLRYEVKRLLAGRAQETRGMKDPLLSSGDCGAPLAWSVFAGMVERTLKQTRRPYAANPIPRQPT